MVATMYEVELESMHRHLMKMNDEIDNFFRKNKKA